MPAVSKAAKEHSNALHRERHAWYKQHGICPRCLNWSEPGKVYCGNCYKRIKAVQNRRDPTHELRNAYNRERRARLKAAGLCTNCGKRPTHDGQILCEQCKIKNRESQLKYNIKQKIRREAENRRMPDGNRDNPARNHENPDHPDR